MAGGFAEPSLSRNRAPTLHVLRTLYFGTCFELDFFFFFSGFVAGLRVTTATIKPVLVNAVIFLVARTGQPRAHERLAVLANGPRGALHVGRQPVCLQRSPQAVPLGLRQLHVLRPHVYPGRVLPRVLLADRYIRLERARNPQVKNRRR